MSTTPILGAEDLYEEDADKCACPHQSAPTHSDSSVPPGAVIEKLKLKTRVVRPIAREKLEAIHESVASESSQAIHELRLVEDDNICMPWVRIVKDTKRFNACMRLAQNLGRLDDSRKLDAILRPDLERQDQEVYCVLIVDTQLFLRGYAEIARGARDHVLTPIQDTVRYGIGFAQLYGAQGLAIAHNHPSGKIDPSDADKEVTQSMMKACAANSLLFLDHIIIGMDGYFSFADAGLLPKLRKAAMR